MFVYLVIYDMVDSGADPGFSWGEGGSQGAAAPSAPWIRHWSAHSTSLVIDSGGHPLPTLVVTET